MSEWVDLYQDQCEPKGGGMSDVARKVAAEMRARVARVREMGDYDIASESVEAWADELDPPPKPIWFTKVFVCRAHGVDLLECSRNGCLTQDKMIFVPKEGE